MRYLIIALSILAVLLPLYGSVFEDIPPAKARQLIDSDKGSLVIVDIRTPHEFASGHIKDALNINYYDPAFESMISELDRDRTYLIYCRSGNRSSHAMPVFKRNNFEKVYNMTGGIIQWQKKGYPLSR